MIRALYTASTGMKAQLTNIDVITNNLANTNTTGYKKSEASFQDLLYQTLSLPGATTGPDSQHPTGQQVGVGTKLAGISKNFSTGSLSRTDRELDIAIAGAGFIPLRGPDGETVYTRDGTFSLSAEGQIVNANGLPVEGLGSVGANARSVNFSPDGQVSWFNEKGEETPIGQIQLALFLNSSGLEAMGGNLYQKSIASGEPQSLQPGVGGAGMIQQHFLEMSNVSIVEEMVKLISAQRAYDLNSKGIRAADEMLQSANSIVR